MVARSELILRWSVYGAAGLLVCLVQGLILQRLDLWGVMPFLYPALAAMVAVWEGAVPCGAVYALCLGAACDLALPGGIPCFYTIAFPLAAMLAGLLTRGWLSSNLLSAMAASALGYHRAPPRGGPGRHRARGFRHRHGGGREGIPHHPPRAAVSLPAAAVGASKDAPLR